MKLRILTAVVVLALGAALAAQSTLSPEALLKAAINREVVDGDVAGAIQQYKDIATKYATNHAVAAGALLRLAALYEKQGNAEARPTYQRIVNQYADSGTPANTARARLATMQRPSAGIFRERTIERVDSDGFAASHDGRWVAYVRQRDPAARPVETFSSSPDELLCIRDLDSNREQVIVSVQGTVIGSFEWSPDDRQISFVQTTTTAPRESALRLVTVAGGRATGEAKTIAPLGGFMAAVKWAPDSRHLAWLGAVRDGTPQSMHLYSLVDGTNKPLGRSIWAGMAWSLDSTRLAYLPWYVGAPARGRGAPRGQPDLEGNIRVVNTAGVELQSLPLPRLSSEGNTTVRTWTSDNRILIEHQIAGGGPNDDYSISTTGGEIRRICEGRGGSGGDGCQSTSPDGLWQITRKNVTGGGRIVLKHTNDGTERPLTPESVIEQTVGSGFSLDGRLFSFRSNRDGKWAVYVVPTDRLPVANPVSITPLEFASSVSGGWWTSRGLILNFNNSQTNIYKITLDPKTGRPTSGALRLTESAPINGEPVVSPDNSRIAYLTRQPGGPLAGNGFALMESNGSKERLIKYIPPDMLVRMSLLGWRSAKELVVADIGPGRVGAPEILLLNVETGETRKEGLAFDNPMILGGYLPTLDAILTTAGPPPQRPSNAVGVTALGTGAKRELTNAINCESGNAMSVMASADGGRLVYGCMFPAPGSASGPRRSDLHVLNTRTGQDRVLTGVAPTPLRSISADGRFLIYVAPRQTAPELLMMDLDTGTSWPVAPGWPRDLSMANLRWAPDGSFVLIDGSSTGTSTKLFEGVTYDAITKQVTTKK